jgi:hypothetical protein
MASLLYVATDILAVTRWDGYSPIDQTVSELFAIDAPTRPLVLPLHATYALLVYAFGVGIWQSAGRKPTLRTMASLLVGKEVIGLMVLLFAPIHLRGVAPTLSDTMHGILTGIGVLLFMFPAMGFGAAAFGRRFRIYTIATMAVFLVCGVLAGLEAPQLAANLPTPWAGLWERTNIYGYMLWAVVVAIALLRAQSDSLGSEDQARIEDSMTATN